MRQRTESDRLAVISIATVIQENGLLRDFGDWRTAWCRGWGRSNTCEDQRWPCARLVRAWPSSSSIRASGSRVPCDASNACPWVGEHARCPCIDDRPCGPVEAMPPPGSRREQEPLAQQVELGAPKHRALQHLQAVDLAFDRAITPGQHQAGFHGFIVRAQPYGKALHRRYPARDGPRQPVIKTVGLTLAHDRTKVLREVDRHRHFTVLGLELHDERRVLIGTLPR